jgi:hypothetical protein
VDDNSATPGVRFTVDARMLSVNNGVNDKDQAEVQSNMQTRVLESYSYSNNVFTIDPRPAERGLRLENIWRFDLGWDHQTGDPRRHS